MRAISTPSTGPSSMEGGGKRWGNPSFTTTDEHRCSFASEYLRITRGRRSRGTGISITGGPRTTERMIHPLETVQPRGRHLTPTQFHPEHPDSIAHPGYARLVLPRPLLYIRRYGVPYISKCALSRGQRGSFAPGFDTVGAGLSPDSDRPQW